MPMETQIEKKTHFTEHTIRSQHEKDELKEGNLCSSVCPKLDYCEITVKISDYSFKHRKYN
jgi:hypothetical protein